MYVFYFNFIFLLFKLISVSFKANVSTNIMSEIIKMPKIPFSRLLFCHIWNYLNGK